MMLFLPVIIVGASARGCSMPCRARRRRGRADGRSPNKGTNQSHAPARSPHVKCFSPATKFIAGANDTKQYTQRKLNERSRTVSGRRNRRARGPCSTESASISAYRPRKVTIYQGQNQGLPSAQ